MRVTSSRFGELEVPDDAVVTFPGGLVGLGGSRYALLARNDQDAFLWLQSLDDPELALPVVDPSAFFPNSAIELAEQDAARIGLADPADAALYVIVRAAEGGTGFSANLRAPIVVLGGVGHQLVNQAPDAPVRAPLSA